jgi:hypothetical protein
VELKAGAVFLTKKQHNFFFWIKGFVVVVVEVVEHGLGHLPFKEKQVITPTGEFYHLLFYFSLVMIFQLNLKSSKFLLKSENH